MITVTLNGVKVDIKNELFWDFVSNQGNPIGGRLAEDIIFEMPKGGGGVQFIESWIDQGKFFNPIPARVVDDTVGEIFRGHGYLASIQTEIECDIVRLHVKNDFESFFDWAEGFDMQGIVESGYPVDSFEVYYVIKDRNNRYEQALAIITLGLALLSLSSAFTSLTIALTSVIVSPASVIFATTNFAFTLAQLIAISAVLFNLLYGDMKPTYCVDVYSLIEACCNYYGLNFESSVLRDYAGLSMVTASQFMDEEKSIKEFSIDNLIEVIRKRIPNYTLANFIREINKLFNTKARVIDGTLYLEELEFFLNKSNSNFVIDRMNVPVVTRFNFDEIPQSYRISYARDSVEQYTYQNLYESYSVSFLSNGNNKESGVNIEKSSNFSIGFPADNQTTLGQILRNILAVIASFGGAGGGLRDREGALLLENEYITSDKLFIRKKRKPSQDYYIVDKNNNPMLAAKALYDAHHAKYTPEGDYCFATYVGGISEQGICSESLLAKLAENNIARDEFGNVAIVTKHTYNASTNGHEFEYKVFGLKNAIGNRWTEIPIPEITKIDKR